MVKQTKLSKYLMWMNGISFEARDTTRCWFRYRKTRYIIHEICTEFCCAFWSLCLYRPTWSMHVIHSAILFRGYFSGTRAIAPVWPSSSEITLKDSSKIDHWSKHKKYNKTRTCIILSILYVFPNPGPWHTSGCLDRHGFWERDTALTRMMVMMSVHTCGLATSIPIIISDNGALSFSVGKRVRWQYSSK